MCVLHSSKSRALAFAVREDIPEELAFQQLLGSQAQLTQGGIAPVTIVMDRLGDRILFLSHSHR